MSKALTAAALDYERATKRRAVAGLFDANIGELEGNQQHIDSQGILTSAYGINLTIPEYKQWEADAIKANKGKPLPMKAYLDKGRELFMAGESHYRKVLGDKGFDSLGAQQQFTLLSARYNTGDTYKSQANAMLAYNADPSADNLRAVIKQSRRTERVVTNGVRTNKKNYTVGMDNRAFMELVQGGFVDPMNVEHRQIVSEELPEANPALRNPHWDLSKAGKQ
jgi:hypothetical protein